MQRALARPHFQTQVQFSVRQTYKRKSPHGLSLDEYVCFMSRETSLQALVEMPIILRKVLGMDDV